MRIIVFSARMPMRASEARRRAGIVDEDDHLASPKTRLPLLSSLVDAAYGTLPAPGFLVGAEKKLAPHAMMDTVPGFVLFFAAVAAAAGVVYLTSVVEKELLSRHAIVFPFNLQLAAFLPILTHWVLFVCHALPYKSEKTFDLAGQLGFSAMAVYAFLTRLGLLPIVPGSTGKTASFPLTTREAVGFIMVEMWSIRLGYYLFSRILERKSDFRFVEARTRYGYHFFTFTMQGIWCVFQAASYLVMLAACASRGDASSKTPSWIDTLGVLVWACGLACETAADIQKLNFVRRYDVNPAARASRPWIEEGLWKYSRHPNFAGESMCWIGFFLYSLRPLRDHGLMAAIAVSISAPIFSVVFLQQTTVPWLEILADRKFGNHPNAFVRMTYEEYLRSTSAYLILPKRPTWV